MNTDELVRPVVEESEKREAAILALSNQIDLFADKLAEACKHEDYVTLKSGKTVIQFDYLPNGSYRLDFHWSRTGNPGYHCLTRERKTLRDLEAFASLVTPKMVEEVTKKFNKQTETLTNATDLLKSIG